MKKMAELGLAGGSGVDRDLLLQEPPSVWRHVPRGVWLASAIGAGLIALSMWAGVAIDAAGHLRVGADVTAGAGAQNPDASSPALAFLAVCVPSVVIMITGGAIGGMMAIQAALLRPTERTASRFLAAIGPVLALIVGTSVAALAVAYVLSTITVAAAGLAPDWDLLPRAAAVITGIGVATGFTGLVLATMVGGAMLRPRW